MHNVNQSTRSHKWIQRLQGTNFIWIYKWREERKLWVSKHCLEEASFSLFRVVDYFILFYFGSLVVGGGWFFFFFSLNHQDCELLFCSVKAKFHYYIKQLYQWWKNYTTWYNYILYYHQNYISPAGWENETIRNRVRSAQLLNRRTWPKISQYRVNTGLAVFEWHVMLCHKMWDLSLKAHLNQCCSLST